jgi:Zn-dependent protease with chaperone function
LVPGGVVLVVGVTLISLWRAPALVAQIVHLCQMGWEAGAEHLSAPTALIVPAILVVGLLRGTAHMIRQWWLTRRHVSRLGVLSYPVPDRLIEAAETAGIGQRITFIASDQPFAFCVGLWRPQVWVSAGLLDHLDDDELIAVLRHEAHHLHLRDPLRLLVVRALRDALFFLPVVRDLSWWYEVEQEICADRAAGEVLPLASALHKLLVSGGCQSGPRTMAISRLSVTEVRIRQLARPESRLEMGLLRPSLAPSLVVVLVMLGLALAPDWLLTPHPTMGIEACIAEPLVSVPATLIN